MSGIFNKSDRDRISEEAKKAREERNKQDSRALLDPAHPHILSITSLESGSWKSSKGGEVTYIQAVIEVANKADRSKFRPITARWNVDKTDDCQLNIEMGIKIFIDFLENSFGAQIPDAGSMEEMLRKLRVHIESPFRAAIRHKERLWVKKEEGTADTPIKTIEVVLYYTDKIDNAIFKGTKASARFIPMSKEEQDEFNRLDALNTGSATKNEGLSDSFDMPDVTSNDDPFS